MQRLIRLVALTLLTPALVLAQKNCKKGIPCGGTCIAANKVCHVGTSTPAPAPATTEAPRAAHSDTAAVAAGADAPWVASSIGRTYYRNGCAGASKLKAENRIYFKSEDEAKAAGLRRSSARGC